MPDQRIKDVRHRQAGLGDGGGASVANFAAAQPEHRQHAIDAEKLRQRAKDLEGLGDGGGVRIVNFSF